MSQVIISVGREFGSGGKAIAEQLAKRFNIPIYDRHLITEIADKTELLDTAKKISKSILEYKLDESYAFDDLDTIKSQETELKRIYFRYRKGNETDGLVLVYKCSAKGKDYWGDSKSMAFYTYVDITPFDSSITPELLEKINGAETMTVLEL